MNKEQLLELRQKLQDKIVENLKASGIINYPEWYNSESISEQDIDDVFDKFLLSEKEVTKE